MYMQVSILYTGVPEVQTNMQCLHMWTTVHVYISVSVQYHKQP